jgi:hypothetical protein
MMFALNSRANISYLKNIKICYQDKTHTQLLSPGDLQKRQRKKERKNCNNNSGHLVGSATPGTH